MPPRTLEDDAAVHADTPPSWGDGDVDRADGDAPRTEPVHDSGLDAWITAGIVVSCVVFAFLQLQPELIFRSSTPAGGDMAAHVWAPAYLRDHLLPNWQLTGWSPDWYAGFPALRFYMVPQMLAIVALDVVMPYGIAFKVVSVSGILTLPVAAWALGRWSKLRFPGPALLAVATVTFLFYEGYDIWGGNVLSTMAGEFANSISLTFAIVYLGLVAQGLRTGRHRGWAALAVAMCGLTHVIPLIFAVIATAVMLAVWPSKRGLMWLMTSAPIGALLAAWWMLPFWWQRAYLNDMGWGKLVPPGDAGAAEQLGFWLTYLFPRDLRWVALLAIAGFMASVIRRIRLGWFFAGTIVLLGLAFWLVPQGRLWNARLLPYVYLMTCLLAALGVAQIIQLLVDASSPHRREALRITGAVLAAVVAISVVALPLRAMPLFGRVDADGTYHWLFLESSEHRQAATWARWNFSGYEGKEHWEEYEDVLLTMGNLGERNGCGRSLWEYEKEQLDRYGSPMALMLLPYWTDGCIGSMEGLYFESATTTPFHFLNRSALSLVGGPQRDLPYGAFDIELGVAQLQLLGVRYYMAQSDTATTAASGHPELTEVARSGPWVIYEVADAPLVEPLENQPVVLADVADAAHEWLPVVAPWFQDRSRWDVLLASSGPDEWHRVDAVDGETGQPRNPLTVDHVPLVPVEVSNIEAGNDDISFDVSEVGVPVLVKVSAFPNWEAKGADGPWRVSPSFMVVTPTDTHVELHYGREPVELLGWGLTAIGVVLLVAVFRAGSLRGFRTEKQLHETADDGLDQDREPAGPDPLA
ncbi:MAG: hypothetical protein JJE52_12900 [Acidimicrobiia bacterium]|nr:hypothetical protein [Acidimicrobiia bacterium]